MSVLDVSMDRDKYIYQAYIGMPMITGEEIQRIIHAPYPKVIMMEDLPDTDDLGINSERRQGVIAKIYWSAGVGSDIYEDDLA